MGGGDLNLKKAWHPLTKKNLEKVWLAEQEAEKEKVKLEQLRREKQQEREREELQKLHEESGAKKSEKLDWMYAGSSTAASSALSEDYLLGRRRVDQVLNTKNEVSTSKAVSMGTQSLLKDDDGVLEKDKNRKSFEDPLFRIKQQQQALKKKQALIKKVRKA